MFYLVVGLLIVGIISKIIYISKDKSIQEDNIFVFPMQEDSPIVVKPKRKPKETIKEKELILDAPKKKSPKKDSKTPVKRSHNKK